MGINTEPKFWNGGMVLNNLSNAEKLKIEK